MRKEEGAPKLDIRSADRPDCEPKIDSGAGDLIDLFNKSRRVIRELEESQSAVAIEVAEMLVKIPASRTKRSRIFSPPGTLARSIMSFLFSKKAFDEIFAQAIIDMRQEHAEALAGGWLLKARWVVIRDHLGLCLTVVAYFSATVVKKVVGIWKMIP